MLGPALRTLLILGVTVLLAGCAGEGGVRDASGDLFQQVAAADQAYAEGRLGDAERGYRAVIARVPKDAYAWFRLGNVQLRQGQYTAAIESYRAVLAREPGWEKAYYNLSTAYLMAARAVLVSGLSHVRHDTAEARLGTRLEAVDRLIYEAVPAATGTVASEAAP